MKPFIKLALISIAVVIAIYFLAGYSQAPISGKRVKTTTTPKTTAAVAPKTLILAEIDDQKITGNDFNQYLALFKDNHHEANPAFREMQLRNLINRILLLKEARKQGYFNDEELKKHSSLNATERETMVLRKFLTDHVSRPATIDDNELNAYLKSHPNFGAKSAREELTMERQQQLFLKLMHNLKTGHKIIIHHENLTLLSGKLIATRDIG